jgi:hypothetical protein
MLDFKIDSENPQLLRIAIAYDFFFENYGVFLDAAVAAEKKDKELVDEMEKLMSLSFGIANLFMLMSEVNQEENSNDNV